MFEAIAAAVIILAVFGTLAYAYFAGDEYPNEEELDDFFWDEEYHAPKD